MLHPQDGAKEVGMELKALDAFADLLYQPQPSDPWTSDSQTSHEGEMNFYLV